MSSSPYHFVEQIELEVEEHVTTDNNIQNDHNNNNNSERQLATTYREVFVPLQDPLLQHVLQHYPVSVGNVPSHQEQMQCYWIPTIACGMIQAIFNERPNTLLLFADFDSFINVVPKKVIHASSKLTRLQAFDDANILSATAIVPVQPAMGEPIVTDMNDIDLVSYLHATTTATDILFPTNFHSLASYIQSIRTSMVGATRSDTIHDRSDATTTPPPSEYEWTVSTQKQSDFLSSYGPEQVRATTSWCFGYSPMILTVGYSKHHNLIELKAQ
jgi:hypothetical protein